MYAQKRLDLQSIRGIAIIFVLLFHFFPSSFPNGYIGVDMFFVLSGYLIAMVLSKEKQLSLTSIIQFYYRRIKRIFPLYLLVILFILLSSLFVFPMTDLTINDEAAWPAIFFITNNFEVNKKQDYAEQLNLAQNLFTHTWSLSVEIQFYLLVPILFYFVGKFPEKATFPLLLTIGFSSMFFYCTTPSQIAFNNVFARIWQFCVGILTFHGTNTHTRQDVQQDEEPLLKEQISEEVDDEHCTSTQTKTTQSNVSILFIYILLVVLISLALLQAVVHETTLRLLITVLTAAVIWFNLENHNILLSNKCLIYIGDISYTLYLVHWPVCAYVKINFGTCWRDMSLGLIVSIMLAAAISETYEKYYRQLSTKLTLLLVIVLYCVNIALMLHVDSISKKLYLEEQTVAERNAKFDEGSMTGLTRDEVIKKNLEFDADDLKNLRLDECNYPDEELKPWGWCSFKNLRGKGSKTILLIGNSYANNNARPIYKYCSKTAKNMTMLSFVGCEVLTVSNKKTAKDCEKIYERYLEGVRQVKPDVLFVLQRHIDFMGHDNFNHSDLLYEAARARLRLFESEVKDTIYLMDAMPRPVNRLIPILNGKLKQWKKVINRDLMTRDAYWRARKRIRLLVADCPKCKPLDYSPYFTKNGTFMMYDSTNGLAFFSRALHLTPHGWNQAEPLYRSICTHL